MHDFLPISVLAVAYLVRFIFMLVFVHAKKLSTFPEQPASKYLCGPLLKASVALSCNGPPTACHLQQAVHVCGKPSYGLQLLTV